MESTTIWPQVTTWSIFLDLSNKKRMKKIRTDPRDPSTAFPKGSDWTGAVCLFYLEEKGDENGIPQIKETWISGPILVEALARNEHGHEWGRVLVFEDPDGRVKKWVMPVEMLKGSGEEVRGILLNMGANLSPIPRIRPLINQYLQSCRPRARVRCMSKIGWNKGQFAFPDKSIGQAEGEGVLFQSE